MLFVFILLVFILFSKQLNSIANDEDMKLMSVGKWALYQRYPVIQHL
jgi:hypothetical protein